MNGATENQSVQLMKTEEKHSKKNFKVIVEQRCLLHLNVDRKLLQQLQQYQLQQHQTLQLL